MEYLFRESSDLSECTDNCYDRPTIDEGPHGCDSHGPQGCDMYHDDDGPRGCNGYSPSCDD
jgi:hypothetical protein